MYTKRCCPVAHTVIHTGRCALINLKEYQTAIIPPVNRVQETIPTSNRAVEPCVLWMLLDELSVHTLPEPVLLTSHDSGNVTPFLSPFWFLFSPVPPLFH